MGCARVDDDANDHAAKRSARASAVYKNPGCNVHAGTIIVELPAAMTKVVVVAGGSGGTVAEPFHKLEFDPSTLARGAPRSVTRSFLDEKMSPVGAATSHAPGLNPSGTPLIERFEGGAPVDTPASARRDADAHERCRAHAPPSRGTPRPSAEDGARPAPRGNAHKSTRRASASPGATVKAPASPPVMLPGRSDAETPDDSDANSASDHDEVPGQPPRKLFVRDRLPE